jgi:myosin heavy subunit
MQVLAQEQQAYRADGISCAPVIFQDNQPTVDLIEMSPAGTSVVPLNSNAMACMSEFNSYT